MKSITGKIKYVNICSFKGVTVLEMLAVMAIILILIGVGIPAYESWRNRAKIAGAEAAMAKIGMALEMYKTDIGFYPQASGSDDLNDTSTIVDQYLLSQFNVDGTAYGPYMKHPEEEITNNRMVDPWGNCYRVYTAPGSLGSPNYTLNRSTFYIYSFGPDGTEGTTDDNITSFGD